MDIKLTVVERIILRNQYLILKQLNPDQAEDYDKLITIIERGYEDDYGELAMAFSGDTMPKGDSEEVEDILDMHWALQMSQKGLPTEVEKANVAFPGFDGNDEKECRYMGYARFLVKQDRFSQVDLQEKDFNSHGQRLSRYRRMLQRWKALKSGVEPGQRHNMTAEQIREVLRGYA